MKKLLLAILLLGLGATGGILARGQMLAREQQAAIGALRLHGNVDVRDAQLAFFGQERIAKVLVEEGDRVEPGQLLATLQTERLQAELAAAEARIRAQQALVDRLDHGTRPEEIEQVRAALAAAKVRALNAEQLIARVEETAKSGASSAKDLDNATAALGVAKAEQQVQEQALVLALAGPRQEDKSQAAATLDAMRADLALLQRRLVDSELHAPERGVIQSRLLEPGEMASPERAVLTLALTDPKWVRAYVPEPQLGRIQKGMRASIRSDSFGGRNYDGWVGYLSPVAEFTPKAVETDDLRTQLVYEVRVFVHDPNGELPLGMPVTVDIDTEGATRHTPESRK
jgi:HlyD family secretion protein